MLLTILTFLILLSILALAHEAGHFFSGKKFGVKIKEFGLGLPPRAIGIKRKGTIWSLNFLPFGGFVDLKGQDGEHKQDKDSFSTKPIWQRVLILTAGVLMNFFLAFLILCFLFIIGWPQDITKTTIPDKYIKDKKIMILAVEKGSPAEEAGIKRGDFILGIDEKEFLEIADIQDYIKNYQDQDVSLEVQRQKEKLKIILQPVVSAASSSLNSDKAGLPDKPPAELTDPTNAPEVRQPLVEESFKIERPPARIGVALGKIGVIQYPLHLAIYKGAEQAISLTWRILLAFFGLFKSLFFGKGLAEGFGGPVAIAVITGQAVSLGFIYVLQFAAILSLNLAIINFLPFPALDGGRVMFLFIEKMRGKAVSQKIEGLVHLVGFWILMGLVLLITVRDVFKLIK